MLDTKSFNEEAMARVLKYVQAQAPSLSRLLLQFIHRLAGAVRRSSTELENATLNDFRLKPDGGVMRVFGKGAKSLVAPTPVRLLTRYRIIRCYGT